MKKSYCSVLVYGNFISDSNCQPLQLLLLQCSSMATSYLIQISSETEFELLQTELAVPVVVGVLDPLLHLADPEPVLDQLAGLLGFLRMHQVIPHSSIIYLLL